MADRRFYITLCLAQRAAMVLSRLDHVSALRVRVDVDPSVYAALAAGLA